MKTIEDIMGLRAIDGEIVQNRRKLTEVLCKIGQNPQSEHYDLTMKDVSRDGQWTYHLYVPSGDTDFSGRPRWDTLCTIRLQDSNVSLNFSNGVEPIKLTWLDMRKIRKSFILGRYITVLRPLEALFAHETAVAELSEWTNDEDD